MVLFLTRIYFPEGTNGKLECGGKLLCYTIELPWKQNAKRISCIPEGKYLLKKRFSRKYQWHFEVVGVANRSLILLHPANYALRELQGCIAPVSRLSGAGIGFGSRKACKQLFNFLDVLIQKDEIIELVVTN
ncbi:DUF5675 family protein [Flavobacterium davisii]|uniref:DUF5675 family protein n=1 Tax=Flavobacterium davisii TaxID=2906077 RepID=A0ABW8PLL3_9FLAO